MDEHTITAGVSILLAIVGVAIVALIVSSQARTTSVFSSAAGALESAICVALSPVAGKGCSTNVTSTISFGGL